MNKSLDIIDKMIDALEKGGPGSGRRPGGGMGPSPLHTMAHMASQHAQEMSSAAGGNDFANRATQHAQAGSHNAAANAHENAAHAHMLASDSANEGSASQAYHQSAHAAHQLARESHLIAHDSR